MKIVAWTKKVFGDSTVRESDIFETLHHGNLPPGKSIIRTEKGVGEIDVVAPNVEEEEFAPFNVCPVGTVQVDNACLDNVTKIKPTTEVKERKNTKYNPKTKEWEEYKDKVKVKTCPEDFIYGEETKRINIIGSPQKIKSAGITAKNALDMGIDVMEERDSDIIKLDVDRVGVCVKKEPMPWEYKYIKNISDSIIGYGGYAEYPFWNFDDYKWDALINIAESRYREGFHLKEEEGFAVCKFLDRGYEECYVFDDEKRAEDFKEEFNYYDFSMKLEEDVKERIREGKIGEFLNEKYRENYPKSQKLLDSYTKIKDDNLIKNTMKKLSKKYKNEIDELEKEYLENEEYVNSEIKDERERFFDDLFYEEGFIGVENNPKRYLRELGVFKVSKNSDKNIVLAEEI